MAVFGALLEATVLTFSNHFVSMVVFALTTRRTPLYRLESTDAFVQMVTMESLVKTKSVVQVDTKHAKTVVTVSTRQLLFQSMVTAIAGAQVVMRDTGVSEPLEAHLVVRIITKEARIAVNM